MDETWVQLYDQETKQQSTEWCHSVFPRPKEFRVQESGGKVVTAAATTITTTKLLAILL